MARAPPGLEDQESRHAILAVAVSRRCVTAFYSTNIRISAVVIFVSKTIENEEKGPTTIETIECP